MPHTISNITIAALTVDGTAGGVVTVASTSGFATGAIVYLASDTQASLELRIIAMTATTMTLRSVPTFGQPQTYGIADLSAYLVADSASVTINPQSLPGPGPVDFGPGDDDFGDSDGSTITLHENLSVLGTLTASGGIIFPGALEVGSLDITAAVGAKAAEADGYFTAGTNGGAFIIRSRDATAAVGLRLQNSAGATAFDFTTSGSDLGRIVAQSLLDLRGNNGVAGPALRFSSQTTLTSGNVTEWYNGGVAKLAVDLDGIVNAPVANTSLILRGNRNAADAGTDIILRATAARSAGFVLKVQENAGATDLATLDHDGNFIVAGTLRTNSNSGLTIGGIAQFGHVFMLQTVLGGSIAYHFRADPTDTSPNTGLRFQANAHGTANPVANANITDWVSGSNKVLAVDGTGALKMLTGAAGTSGTATLTNGTVTVNTTAIRTGDKIMVSRNSPGASAALGTLAADTADIVNATSFVIESLDAANAVETDDGSTVNWFIIRTLA